MSDCVRREDRGSEIKGRRRKIEHKRDQSREDDERGGETKKKD